MINIDFLRQLDRFHIILKRRVSSKYSGSRESRSYGQGLTFKDYREYIPGDDFRSIDWKVYARSERFYIKRFEEEKNMTVHIVIDSSASMNYGKETTKFEFAAMIGLGFAYMATKNNEKWEFATFAERLNVFKTKKGGNQIVNVVDICNRLGIKGKSKFSESLLAYKAMVKSKAMVVIISDFLFDIDELKTALFRFKKSKVVVLQILDKEETNLATLHGDIILQDSESDEEINTYISNRLKDNYQTKLGQHMMELQRLCEGLNVTFASFTTETPIFDIFYQVVKTRQS